MTGQLPAGNTSEARLTAGPASSRLDFGRWRRPVRTRLVSGVLNTRICALLLVAVVAGACAFLLGVGLGKYAVPFDDVAAILRGADLGFANTVVLEWRLPRAVAGLVFGAALGVSGAIFQSLTRNPLGSPDVIGLGAGAFTGALLAVLWFDQQIAITILALGGGLVAAAAVYLLAYRRGISGMRFVVVGIAVSSALTAVNQILLLRMSTSVATTANIWGQGTLLDVRWSEIVPASLCVGVLLLLAVPLAPALRQLELGDGMAASTGVRVERSRLGLLLIGVLLMAVVTSIAGPIAFVALVAPQLARLLAGAGGATLAGSGATGALLLSVSDTASAHLFPVSLPVGVVTAVAGGAYLLFLIIREASKR